MNEDRLRALLRDTPVPGADDAERRGLRMVEEAYAQRRPVRRPAPPRLAIALAIATLLAATILSPAGAAVRNWVGDALSTAAPNAEPALTRIPGGGRLLVQSPAGPWVVRPNGSRRLLGSYAAATWSPHGLFVAAAAGHTLSAVEPDGTPRWSLSAAASIRDPAWSPSGFRIAYRAGHRLRVVAADGTGDRLVDPAVAPVPAAWFPPGLHLLAYVDAGERLRIADTDTAQPMAAAPAAPGAAALSWAPDGSALAETTPSAVWMRDVRIRKLPNSLKLGPARRLRLPAGARVRSASFSPTSKTIAVLFGIRSRAGAPRSVVLLVDPHDGSSTQLISLPGRLGSLTWSPDSRRLLVSWPEADQWLFLPTDRAGRARGSAIGAVSNAFAPGNRAAAFPHVAGWCCAARPSTATP